MAVTADYEFKFMGFPISEDGSGLGLNLMIGYAWDEQNMVVYEGNAAGWRSDLLDMDIVQGFYGASWYHYFGPIGKSFFSVAGLGTYAFQIDEYNNARGLGLLFGGGYEFARHWQVAAYFSSGKTKDSGVDFDHTHFNILVSGVAF